MISRGDKPSTSIGAAGQIRRRSTRWRGSASVAAAATACIIGMPEALAQDAAESVENVPADTNAAEQLASEAIIVTGSRIARRDFISNTPITTVDAETLENTSSFALETKLLQLPQFSGTANSQFSTGYFNSGASTLNLRNLGENRNLVLLDGRRLQPSTRETLAIDVNVVPAVLIDNIEIISGGASAVYGADAVSGVVNFKLKQNFEGVALDAYYGIAESGSNEVIDLSALIGGNFAGGSGNAVLALSYSDRGATPNMDIPFYRNGFTVGAIPSSSNFVGYGYYSPVQSNNRPSQAALDAYFAMPENGGAPTGSVTPSTLLGFNNDGTTLFSMGGADIYNYRGELYPRYVIDTYSTPGTASLKQNFQADTMASLPLQRWSVFGRTHYDLSDSITMFGQALYTHYSSTTAGGPPTMANSWRVDVPRDAAHPVPDALAAILDSRPDPNAPWQLNKTLTFMGLGTVEHTNHVFQVLLGLRGQVPGMDLDWEVYGSHGRTSLNDKGVSGFASLQRLREILLAPNYGQNFRNSFGSCTSGISPFGEQNGEGAGQFGDPSLPQVSADCIDYLNPYWTNSTLIKQDIVEATLSGRAFDLPAGEVRFAVGGGYRKTSLKFDADKAFVPDVNYRSDLVGQFGVQSVAGSDSVTEGYAELLLPLIHNTPLLERLEASLAYRYSDYRQSGSTHTYKADVNWEVSGALRLRGGYQRAVRAPNVYEQFGPPTLVFDSAIDPCASNVEASYANVPSNPDRRQVQQLCRTLMGPGAPPITDAVNDPFGLNGYTGSGTLSVSSYPRGNPDLRPEKADTFTVGAVFRPQWTLPANGAFSLSIDYYDIRIKGAIGYVGADLSQQLCFNANGESNPSYDPANTYCRTLGRQQEPGTGSRSGVFSLYLNQGAIKTSGVDVQFDLGFDAGPGRFSIDGIVNYLDSFVRQVGPGAPEIDYAGYTGGYFRWKTLTNLSYSLEQATIGLRWRHLDGAKTQDYIVTPCPPTATRCFANTPSYDLFDLYANGRLNDRLSVRAGIDNLFDRQPPRVRGIPGFTDPQNYDLLGRRFYVGVSAEF